MTTKIRSRIAKTLKKAGKDYFHEQPGSLPGTLNIAADATVPEIELIDYKDTDYVHQRIDTPEDLIPHLDSMSVSWVDVQGLGSEDILQRIGIDDMDNDLLAFLGGAGLLIGYLLFSAATEMGTKLPWKK